MRITDLLKKEAIVLDAKVTTKREAIDTLTGLHEKAGNITDTEQFRQGVLDREANGTTAIGDGIAIPHAKSPAVKRPGLAAITVPGGVDYESMDGKPSNLLFMIAAPPDGDLHLEVLSRLTVLLMDEGFRKNLLAAKSKEAFLSVIDKRESEKFGEEVKAQPAPAAGAYRILAVTACPTGIAHTYMAAEALEQKAQEMGITLKAETDGSGGAKNILTAKEIRDCDGIIIAADKNVEMARFNGKKVLKTKVADGIHKPEELIQRVLDGNVPVYHAEGGKQENTTEEKEGVGHTIYKHLMNGVSHMLPFVIGGGILIAVAFLIDTIMGAPAGANFGSTTPVAAFFKSMGGYAFNFMLPILAGYIAMSIADRPGLLVGFVGGSLAALGSTFMVPGGDIPSGFLGALFAGFVGGYLMLLLRKLCDHLPKALEGIKPVLIYPVLGLLLIAVVMCAVNPIMGWINTGLNNLLASLSGGSKILLGCILGGMMAIDMGGPFNKAAYLFGTGSLTQAAALIGQTDAASQATVNSSYEIMAAVMIGGMIPPLAIALATTFFKNRFSESERKSGVVNYIMGLCFITEGAIPYAASDPLRVIPACIVGSAAAGGLSMAFGCTLMAPHGGIFVLPVMGGVGWYALSILIGALVGMFMLAILKKPKYTVEKKQKKAR